MKETIINLKENGKYYPITMQVYQDENVVLDAFMDKPVPELSLVNQFKTDSDYSHINFMADYTLQGLIERMFEKGFTTQKIYELNSCKGRMLDILRIEKENYYILAY